MKRIKPIGCNTLHFFRDMGEYKRCMYCQCIAIKNHLLTKTNK
jgi:hypothetical protein